MAKRGLGSDKVSPKERSEIAKKGGEARGRQMHEEAEQRKRDENSEE